jgi:hypothetical protein
VFLTSRTTTLNLAVKHKKDKIYLMKILPLGKNLNTEDFMSISLFYPKKKLRAVYYYRMALCLVLFKVSLPRYITEFETLPRAKIRCGIDDMPSGSNAKWAPGTVVSRAKECIFGLLFNSLNVLTAERHCLQ